MPFLKNFLRLSVPLYVLDQITKWYIVWNYKAPSFREGVDTTEVIPGFFDIVRVHNTGVAWKQTPRDDGRFEATGGEAHPIVANLADPSAIEQIIREVEVEYGSVDIVVNNAAAAFYGPFTGVTEKQLRLVTEVNFFAPWRLSQLVVPGMSERGEGWILNISSADAIPSSLPFKEWDALSILYGSTKAALDRFTAGLAAAVAEDGLHVNTLAPVGAVPTEGAEAQGAIPPEALAVAESREAMAEAALGLCTTIDPSMTARITYCTPILEELGRDVYTLDAKTRLDGPSEAQAAPFRR